MRVLWEILAGPNFYNYYNLNYELIPKKVK